MQELQIQMQSRTAWAKSFQAEFEILRGFSPFALSEVTRPCPKFKRVSRHSSPKFHPRSAPHHKKQPSANPGQKIYILVRKESSVPDPL
jgi:hypothetical protein